MKTLYLIIVLCLLVWKGYYAWHRGRRAYSADMERYRSFYEYLLGNGATHRQARRPFFRHAVARAVLPMLRQWRLWLIVAVVGVLVMLIF